MSVLKDCTLSASMVRMEDQACWILRANLEKETIRQALESLSLMLPNPLAVTESKGLCALGISFDEVWWILPNGKALNFLGKVRKALEGEHCALIENSDAYISYHLQGQDADLLLSHLVPYDWFSDNSGKVIATVMQSVPLTIYKKPKGEGYHLMIRQSFAKHAERFIHHTAHIL